LAYLHRSLYAPTRSSQASRGRWATTPDVSKTGLIPFDPLRYQTPRCRVTTAKVKFRPQFASLWWLFSSHSSSHWSVCSHYRKCSGYDHHTLPDFLCAWRL
jgi:hypothetical protein